MGRLSAFEMASYADIRTAVSWHLSANCYPPVPSVMVPVCVRAIEAMIAGDSDEPILLPEGVLYRESETAPAWAIMENFRLEGLIDGLLSGEGE